MKSSASELGIRLFFSNCQVNKVTRDLICICKQKTFSPVSSINLSQKDTATLPVKTSGLPLIRN